MTPAEVNAEIARIRGWDVIGVTWIVGESAESNDDAWRMQCPECDASIGPPDYCGSWALAGPLLEEMGNARTEDNEFNTPGIVRDSEMWIASENIDGCGEFGHGGTTESAPTPTEAIARAWLAWKRAAT